MDKDIKIEKPIEILIKFILVFSCPVLTIILSNQHKISHTLIGALLSFITMLITIKKVSIKNLNMKNFIISILISCYMMKNFINFTNETIMAILNYIDRIISVDFINNYIYGAMGMMALPALMLFVYLFIDKIIPRIIQFFKELTNAEKKYFKIMLCIGIVSAIIITLSTTAFSKPCVEGDVKAYNIIYTTDSGALAQNDTFFNVSYIENDVRQPLFGVFALPFAVLAKIISEFLFFVPHDYTYEIAITIIQFILTTITIIMIGKLLKLEEKDKKYLYLLFNLSFPYLIFNLIIEQYVISLFYLILTIYNFYTAKEINYVYIGATGTLITSGILFPFITSAKGLKQKVIDISKCILTSINIFIISGQFPQIFLFGSKLNMLLNNFAGKVSFKERVDQFANFVKSIFFSFKGEIINNTYQIENIENLSVIGIIILVIIVISFLINRKEKMAQISILWLYLSIILLLIIGWGTKENGLVIYSLYFSWAYLILFYLFLKKLCKSRKLFIWIITAIIFIMAIYNIKELFNIIMFAIKYY